MDWNLYRKEALEGHHKGLSNTNIHKQLLRNHSPAYHAGNARPLARRLKVWLQETEAANDPALSSQSPGLDQDDQTEATSFNNKSDSGSDYHTEPNSQPKFESVPKNTRSGRLQKTAIKEREEIYDGSKEELKQPLSVIDPVLLDWSSRIAPEPNNSGKWEGVREQLFRYHEKRQQLLEMGQKIRDFYLELLPNGLGSDTLVLLSPEMRGRVLEVQEAQRECLHHIRATKLETTILEEVAKLVATCKNSTNDQNDEVLGNLLKYSPQLPFETHSLFHHLNVESSLEKYATPLCKVVGFVMNEISTSRFKGNLQEMLLIVQRLPLLASSKMPERGYGKQKHIKREHILHDNIFHAQKLLQIFLDEFRESQRGAIYTTWIQIVSILAICFGCTSEPAFFISTLDRLLDQLREQLLNNPQKLDTHLSSLEETTLQSFDETQAQNMFMKSRRHSQFTELALFIRGSLITSVNIACCQWVPKNRLKGLEIWEGLLRWKKTCPVCQTDIRAQDLVGNYPIRIGVKDARVGDHQARLEVSTNRPNAYDCLTSLILPNIKGHRWNENLAPFLFYYADVYHPLCKLHREKD